MAITHDDKYLIYISGILFDTESSVMTTTDHTTFGVLSADTLSE